MTDDLARLELIAHMLPVMTATVKELRKMGADDEAIRRASEALRSRVR
jgi:hypothetical protein